MYVVFGTLKITGKLTNIEKFLMNACHGTALENNVGITVDGMTQVEGTECGYIVEKTTFLFYPNFNKNSMASFDCPYGEPEDISADNLKKISKEFKIDFRIDAFESNLNFFRNIEIKKGKIVRNEYSVNKNVSENPLHINQTKKTHGQYKGFLTAEQIGILNTVAAKQKKKFIDKCPRCGQDNMYSYKGKTYSILSKQADIYICRNCQEEEADFDEDDNLEDYYPLSEWAVFKIPEAKNNGSGEI